MAKVGALAVQVVCSLCDYEQDVKQVCERCGVCMGDYYCDKCKFFDDKVSTSTESNLRFHCEGLHRSDVSLSF